MGRSEADQRELELAAQVWNDCVAALEDAQRREAHAKACYHSIRRDQYWGLSENVRILPAQEAHDER